MSYVLVLNASYEPLHRVGLEHAVKMLCRGVAVIEESDHTRTFGPFPFPRILRLVRYISMKFRYRETPRWSRAALFARDGWRCVYCGKGERGSLTVDHIVPRSRGGETSWENTVTACGGKKGCNAKKADRTPAQAGFRYRVNPVAPTWDDYIARISTVNPR